MACTNRLHKSIITGRSLLNVVQEIQLSVFNMLLKIHHFATFSRIDQKVENLNLFIVNPFHGFQRYPVSQ